MEFNWESLEMKNFIFLHFDKLYINLNRTYKSQSYSAGSTTYLPQMGKSMIWGGGVIDWMIRSQIF